MKVYNDEVHIRDGLVPAGTLWTKDLVEGVCMLFVALATLVSPLFLCDIGDARGLFL